MSLTDLIIRTFCLVDDALPELTRRLAPETGRLRQRGPAPQLADSEVLTIELVGTYLGLATDAALFRHFRRHHADLFPKLRSVHRTTFTRQAANLWAVKHLLWEGLTRRAERDARLSLVDSTPLPVCRLARAYRCKRLAEHATYGFDEMAKQVFYGLRVHLRVTWPGVITAFELAPANAHDVRLAPEVLVGAVGTALGDRNYHSPALKEELAAQGLALVTPPKRREPEERWPRRLSQIRRRIETVIGQLVERFRGRRMWARDLWHLVSRWYRRLCAHTLAVVLCQEEGLPPLRFSELLTD
jgi:hypothetical protein